MINGKKVIALSGVECTGKTTLALMLAGRLRSRGVLADVVCEPGSSAPFPGSFLDKGDAGWSYLVTNHVARQIAALARPNIEWLILDRTPLDFMIYYHARFPATRVSRALQEYAANWARQYDFVYLLEPKAAAYREDGHRAPADTNDWRETCKRSFFDVLVAELPEAAFSYLVQPTYRESAEWVYHDILARGFDESRPKRAYQQVRDWLAQQGWRVLEVRAQGSNSITRFHTPTDHDDIDMIVVVDGDAPYAVEVRADFLRHQSHLENIVQASLDVLITPAGLEAYEM